MNSSSKLVSCVLAAIAGVCFVAGISLLSDEGSDIDYGTREETHGDA